MEKQLFIKQLKPGLYLMDEAHEATGYLVIGEDRACVIDTMNGYNDLSAFVRSVTDKPVFVVNTHGHPDHIFGNLYFEKAYLHPDDMALAESFVSHPEFAAFAREKGRSMPPFLPMRGGDVFDLGGRTLEVFELPGHTAGSVVLLLKEDRILFTGDAVNHHLWMQLDGCLNMHEFVSALDKVLFLEERADRILHGHARDFDDISLLRCLLNGAKEICDGKKENDKPYPWFGGVAKQHPFRLEAGKIYQQANSVICYSEQNI